MQHKDGELLREAWKNQVMFPDFDFLKVIRDGELDPPLLSDEVRNREDILEDWSDSTPRIGVDKNGDPIVAFFPGFLTKKGQEYFFDAAMKLSEDVPPETNGADRGTRNKVYVHHHNQKAGQIKFVKSWYPVGHPGGDSKINAQILGNATRFTAATAAAREMSFTSERINGMLKNLDPAAFKRYSEFNTRLKQAHAHVNAINAVDPIVYQGRIILFNRKTPFHADTQGPPSEWNCLHALGHFTGGSFRIRRLGLRMRYEPGDMFFIRGSILEHEVEDFEGGQRISVTYFSHTNVWEEMGLSLDSVYVKHPHAKQQVKEQQQELGKQR